MMDDSNIKELEDTQETAYTMKSRVQTILRRTDIFFGVLIGVLGNLLVSYWIEFQILRDKKKYFD